MLNLHSVRTAPPRGSHGACPCSVVPLDSTRASTWCERARVNTQDRTCSRRRAGLAQGAGRLLPPLLSLEKKKDQKQGRQKFAFKIQMWPQMLVSSPPAAAAVTARPEMDTPGSIDTPGEPAMHLSDGSQSPLLEPGLLFCDDARGASESDSSDPSSDLDTPPREGCGLPAGGHCTVPSCSAWMHLPIRAAGGRPWWEVEGGAFEESETDTTVQAVRHRAVCWTEDSGKACKDWMGQPTSPEESLSLDVLRCRGKGVVVSYLHVDSSTITPLFTM